MLNNIIESKNTLLAPYNGLKVTWFDSWHPVIDEALQLLPEMETCPHELFRLLIETHGADQKRITLFTEKGVPVAVAGLRRISRRYRFELVTWIIIPDSIFPTQPGYLMPALEALGVEVIVCWRRMHSPRPSSLLMRDPEELAVYQIQCSTSFEDYWRESGHWNTIKRCRNRCRNFNHVINPPGGVEWTIKNWGPVWDVDPILVDDSILSAKYMENQGQHYTFLLLDGEKPVAGHTFLQHGQDMVWQVTYRDPTYDKFGVGTRLMDIAFHWIAEAGYNSIDLGGRHTYKVRWAPPVGEMSIFTICPEPLFRAKQILKKARSIPGKLSGLGVENREI